jgi:hypothetical protein
VNIGTSGVAGSTTNIAIGSTTGTSTTTLQGTTNGVTEAVDTNNTELATTAFVVGQAGSATPIVDGTAAVGTSLRYARQDHVHPTDTSRAALASPTFTGIPAAPTAAVDTNTTQLATTAYVVGQGYLKSATASSTYAPLASPSLTGTPLSTTAAVDTNTTQIATTAYVVGNGYLKSATASSTYAPLASPALTGTPLSTTAAVDTNTTQIATTAFVVGQAASATPLVNGTAAVGTSLRYARADHVHPTDTSRAAVDSQAFTGTPSLPTGTIAVTQTAADSTTALATTAFVTTADNLKANLASPTFTGTPSLPTGTTGVTQTAGDNTTALATTAFVTAAVPAFATVPQVLTLTSTTTAISPLNNYIGSLNPAHFSPDVAQLSSTVTGTGSSSTLNANGYTVQLGSTVGSYATRSQTLWPNRVAVTGNLQWTRPVGFAIRVAVYNRMDVNAQWGISFGQATATLATPTVRSIGCYFAASAANTPGVLVLEVHDGTSYYTVNSSYTPTFNLLFDVACYSDGAGNAYLYVNGSQVATSANAPSTNGGTTYQTVLQAGYKAVGTPTGTSNSVFQCLKFLTN